MEIVDKVKSRRQGNSIVVPLSSELNIEEDKEFYVYKSESGAITLIPKVEDYFQTLNAEDFVIDEDSDSISRDYMPQGSEWANDGYNN
ncbi:hypothetical protein HZY86_01920 [Aerococcaceae bacterium DSM 111020]|nr:hypothetical protein [Aerococcaceae bacterium DSM 111020]